MLTIAYWSTRGLGAPLRMAAHFGGLVDTVDVTYKCYDTGPFPSPDFKKSWLDSKAGLIGDHPMINLPHLVTPSSLVVQSNACLYSLARLLDLGGSTEGERQAVDMVLAQTMDLRNASAIPVFYNGNPSMTPEKHRKYTVVPMYAKLDGFMAVRGTRFSASDTVTVADFHLWEMLDQHEMYFEEKELESPLGDFGRLERLHREMRGREEMRTYFDSKYARLPCNGPHAVNFVGECKQPEPK